MKLALSAFLIAAALIAPVIPTHAKTPHAAKSRPIVVKKANVKKAVHRTRTVKKRVPPRPVYPLVEVREGC